MESYGYGEFYGEGTIAPTTWLGKGDTSDTLRRIPPMPKSARPLGIKGLRRNKKKRNFNP